MFKRHYNGIEVVLADKFIFKKPSSYKVFWMTKIRPAPESMSALSYTVKLRKSEYETRMCLLNKYYPVVTFAVTRVIT